MSAKIRWVDRDEARRFGAPAVALAAGAALEAAGPPALRPVPAVRSTPRDELIFLLHIAAEIEHALMVQYLYAAYSLAHPEEVVEQERKDLLSDWRETLLQIAREEMGHLATVLNLLRAVGGPINLEREDYPFRSQFYPFHFQLEALSRHSLAKYVLAERPQGLAEEVLQGLLQDARMEGEPAEDEFRRVGALFDQIRDLLEHPEVDLLDDSAPLQAGEDAWRGDTFGMELHVATSVPEALVALQRVAEQGEGSEAGDLVPVEDSHFGRLFALYQAFPADDAWTPTRRVPRNPTIRPGYGETEITDPISRVWAQHFDLRYRGLLFDLAHAYASDDGETPRRRAVRAMGDLARIADRLTGLGRVAGSLEERAAPTFHLPFTLAIPSREADRLRSRRDIARASQQKLADLAALGVPADDPLVARLRARDEALIAEIDAIVPPFARELHAIRILPPIAIARLGSADTPLDNYDLELDPATGRRRIVPAETLDVDRATGQITGARIPETIEFKDGERVRPLAPFFEVWGQFREGGQLVPLTHGQLAKLRGTIRWQVRAGNLKIVRRTGDPRDRIVADTGEFADHAVQPLTGACVNFKQDKTIPLGSAQFLADSPGFPEIRLRITPAPGRVYGSDPTDGDIADDPYNPTETTWVGHRDGTDGRPLSTQPGGIFARGPDGGGLGYLDDSCDGIVDVAVSLPDRDEPLRASARFTAGPPDYAPDSRPVRSVAHELQQLVFGHDAAEQTERERLDDVIELIRGAVDNVRLMHTDSMNRGGMAFHDTGLRRAREPIFRPVSRANYRLVLGFHLEILSALERYRDEPGDTTRAAALGVLSEVARRLRTHDGVGDLTDAGRQLMPAMMRGSDGRHLAVTRRQFDQVRRLVADLDVTPSGDPRDAMINLIEVMSAFAGRHDFVELPDGTPLSDLFADPPRLLEYLTTSTIQGSAEPLVVPGDPGASGFVRLISQGSGHPMAERFTEAQREVVRAWIRFLGN